MIRHYINRNFLKGTCKCLVLLCPRDVAWRVLSRRATTAVVLRDPCLGTSTINDKKKSVCAQPSHHQMVRITLPVGRVRERESTFLPAKREEYLPTYEEREKSTYLLTRREREIDR